jgi:hypothetical protein
MSWLRLKGALIIQYRLEQKARNRFIVVKASFPWPLRPLVSTPRAGQASPLGLLALM